LLTVRETFARGACGGKRPAAAAPWQPLADLP